MSQIQEQNLYTKGTNNCRFCSWTLENCLLWHIFS